MSLSATILRHVAELADRIGPRPTGSPGNLAAGAYIRDQLARPGWQVDTPQFDCLVWEPGAAVLTCGPLVIPAQANPYSPCFSGSLPFTVCSTVQDLARCSNLADQILVMSGDLAREQYMPRRFPFLTIPEQQEVFSLLDRVRPAAIIGVHSSPLFCDGDLSIPSVTIPLAAGGRLAQCAGNPLSLSISGRTSPATACNVIASSPVPTESRVVICAHYDTWFETPGGIDNAGGVAALLTLAELLPPGAPVELVAFNGEDHYAAPGQVQYTSGDMSGIRYVVNLDGIGVRNRPATVACFGRDVRLAALVGELLEQHPLLPVEPWPEGDHMIFVRNQIPAIALSSDAADLWSSVTHTPFDTGDRVDSARVCEVVMFVRDLLAVV